MLTVYEILSITIVLGAFAALVAYVIRLKTKNNLLVKSIVEVTLDKMALQKKVDEASMSPSETEGFIKFLSQSREWAFGYIEEVQKSIENLKIAMQDGNEDKINKAYEDVVSFLPAEEKND